MTKQVLLHICCAVCAGHPVQKLRQDGFEVTGYFYNPNIYPLEEYERRLENARLISKTLNIELVEGNYDHEIWLSKINGFESEREGGLRCNLCFTLRLDETLKKTKELEILCFTSTLTVSPHKNSKVINESGTSLSIKNTPLDELQEMAKKFTFRSEDCLSSALAGRVPQQGKGSFFAIPRDTFLPYDFKKQDGFKKSRDFARQNNIYCQNYCGCEFSAKKS